MPSFCSEIIWAILFFLFLFISPSLSGHLSPSNNVTLFGDASFGNNGIRLTQHHNCASSSGNQYSSTIGRAFYVNPIRFLDVSTNATASFSCSFSFSIISSPSCPFGDGLAFLITSNTNSLSTNSGCMGLPEEETDQDSYVAIEFDTSFNPNFQDVNGNHVGVDVNKIISLASVDVVSRGIDLKSGKEMSVWIEYRDSEKLIRVWVGYTKVRPLNPVLVAQLDLSMQLKEFMHVGFTASNGRGSSIHRVNLWRFKTFWFQSSAMAMDTVEEGNCLMCFPEDTNNGVSAASDGLGKMNLGLIAIIGISVAIVVILLAVCLILCFCWMKRRRKAQRGIEQTGRFRSDRVPKNLSLAEIKEATRGFSQDRIIGEGGSAVVYEGAIPSCGSVAVKRFHQGTRISSSQNIFDTRLPFDNEFGTVVGCLRHKNLVQLKGWCCERNELVLVYEYLPNGSLDRILHRQTSHTKFLTWEKRLNILHGVASALVYLHEECVNQIIHRDIKTCNIMLDADLNAKLGDFGLAEVYEHSPTARDATVPAGTMGYLAPEYAFSGVPTVKTDVYSFGVVVLEVASGRRPVDDNRVVITDWVWDLWEKRRLLEAADPKLNGRFSRKEMERTLMLGLCCVNSDHEIRPTMRAAARMLKGESPLPPLPPRKPTVRIQSVLPEGCAEIMKCYSDVEDNTPWSTPRTQFSRA